MCRILAAFSGAMCWTEKKSELLVFLTPRIMNNQAIAVSR